MGNSISELFNTKLTETDQNMHKYGDMGRVDNGYTIITEPLNNLKVIDGNLYDINGKVCHMNDFLDTENREQ